MPAPSPSPAFRQVGLLANPGKRHCARLVREAAAELETLGCTVWGDPVTAGWSGGRAREAADLILKGLNGAIGSKRVTYDFARLMEGATQVKCSEFGDNIVGHM